MPVVENQYFGVLSCAVSIIIVEDLLTTGAIEMSNTDMSTEMTNVISAQRALQANSRIISVSSSNLEELVNLPR